MLPQSLLGLLLFVVLLAPGFAYVLRYEKHGATRPFSPFRETLRVVFVSVVCLLITALIFSWIRWVWPEHSLNVRGLVREPSKFVRDHHVQLAWWSLAFIAAATALAAGAADPRLASVRRSVGSRLASQWLTGSSSTQILPQSQWRRVFEMYDAEGPVLVGVQLDDGSYVRGRLLAYNPAFDESQDRELILSSPLSLTPKGGLSQPYGSQFTIISARRIVRMDVDHLPKGYTFDLSEVSEAGTASVARNTQE